MTTIIRLGWAGPVLVRVNLTHAYPVRLPSRIYAAKLPPNQDHVLLRPLEKDALAADAEHKFIASMRLDLAQVLDQFDSLAPT